MTPQPNTTRNPNCAGQAKDRCEGRAPACPKPLNNASPDETAASNAVSGNSPADLAVSGQSVGAISATYPPTVIAEAASVHPRCAGGTFSPVIATETNSQQWDSATDSGVEVSPDASATTTAGSAREPGPIIDPQAEYAAIQRCYDFLRHEGHPTSASHLLPLLQASKHRLMQMVGV